MGRPIAHRDGEILTGDPEACRQEVRQALVRIKGDEGRIIRQTLVELAAEMKSRRVGVWDESIREFILWTKMPFADGRVGVSARLCQGWMHIGRGREHSRSSCMRS